MHRGTRPLLPLLLVTALSSTLASAAPKDDVSKPIKTVVQSVRYSKDALALKSFAGEEQGAFLLGADWTKGTPAQRKEFVEVFHALFAKIAFPKIRKNFENLDTVLYDEPSVKADRAEISSTILINHPVKKQELKVKYQLVSGAGIGSGSKSGWRIVDAAVLGDSMLQGIRDDQIGPIMKEGGWTQLLALMHEKMKE